MTNWVKGLKTALDTYEGDRLKLALDSCSISLDAEELKAIRNLSRETLMERIGTDLEKECLRDMGNPEINDDLKRILIYRYEGLMKLRKFLGLLHVSYRYPKEKFVC